MAKRNIISNLKKLFSSDIIIRTSKGNVKKVVDINSIQQIPSDYTDKYKRLYGTKSQFIYGPHNLFPAQRLALYRDYEQMDTDPIIGSALDVYADECTVKNEMRQVLLIKSENEKVRDALHNLFYDILNIEFNTWAVVRSLCKYGDFYYEIELAEKHGVLNVRPLSQYETTREEQYDRENIHNVRFKVEGVSGNRTLENYKVLHFRLLSDTNYLPYGKSMIESARKVWKQLTLMEDAMLIHRIMRAPERRIFRIDIGNIPPNEVDAYMEKIIGQIKKVPYIDPDTGEYNLKYNLLNMNEDFYLPVRGGDSTTQIDALPGLQYEVIDDIEYLRNKMMAALKIPKAFLGYEEQVGCVVPETKVPLLNGKIKTMKELIEDYNNGIKNYVYSIDEFGKIVPGEISWAGYTRKNAELLRVHLDNGDYIDSTPDHKYLTRNGQWVEAQNLSKDDKLMPIYLSETTQKNKFGYTTVYHPATNKYQEVHRMVAEHYNLVERGSGKVVHHIDFDKKNNYPENFDCTMTYWEHRKYHQKLTEKTINSTENIQKRITDPTWIKSAIRNGRIGGLKSAPKLVEYNKLNGVWNAGRLTGKFNECVECGNTFYVEPNKSNQTCCSRNCVDTYYVANKLYNTKYTIEYEELINVAINCSSFKELETKIGVTRRTLNRIFEYHNIDKIDFIFNNMPLALKNKKFMVNYQKYELQYKNHKVDRIEILNTTKDTCDITVSKYHNFATNAGVIIHNSKATLAAEDVRFARTIERLQKVVVSEFIKIAIIHLYLLEFDDPDLTDFELSLTNPSIIYEQERLELWAQKLNLARDAKESKMLSKDWIYRNILNFSENEISEESKRIVDDFKTEFRLRQIEEEGNDPAVTNKVVDGDDEESEDREVGVDFEESDDTEYSSRTDKLRDRKRDDAFGDDPLGKRDLKKATNKDSSLSPKTKERKNNVLSIKKKTLEQLNRYKLKQQLLTETKKSGKNQLNYLDESNLNEE